MGAFNALTTHTVTVARRDDTNTDGDVTFGERRQIRVRVRERAFRDSKYGRMIDVFTKILTEHWVFQKTDGVWFEGTDTTDDSDAKSPRIVMTSSTQGIRVSSAEF